jgi:hypothetical protein
VRNSGSAWVPVSRVSRDQPRASSPHRLPHGPQRDKPLRSASGLAAKFAFKVMSRPSTFARGPYEMLVAGPALVPLWRDLGRAPWCGHKYPADVDVVCPVAPCGRRGKLPGISGVRASRTVRACPPGGYSRRAARERLSEPMAEDPDAGSYSRSRPFLRNGRAQRDARPSVGRSDRKVRSCVILDVAHSRRCESSP